MSYEMNKLYISYFIEEGGSEVVDSIIEGIRTPEVEKGGWEPVYVNCAVLTCSIRGRVADGKIALGKLISKAG